MAAPFIAGYDRFARASTPHPASFARLPHVIRRPRARFMQKLPSAVPRPVFYEPKMSVTVKKYQGDSLRAYKVPRFFLQGVSAIAIVAVRR